MELQIQWNQEDLERKLREELEKSGFRVLEFKPGEGAEPVSPFKWGYKPLRVSVIAEPDPEAHIAAQEEESPQVTLRRVRPEQEEAVAREVGAAPDPSIDDIDPTMLPPGVDLKAIRALERAAKAQIEGKPVERRLMKGESLDRP